MPLTLKVALPAKAIIREQPSPTFVLDEAWSESPDASIRRVNFIREHQSSASLHDTYDVQSRPVGIGGFGSVYTAKLRDGSEEIRAVKAVRHVSPKAAALARKEAHILRKLDHPYICRLLEVFTGYNHTYLVMEYVNGEELFEYITRQEVLSDDFALHVMRQVFEALNYCHGLGVIHRDLKPENVMVLQATSSSSMLPPAEVEVKLIDFGLAEITQTLKGTSQPTAMVGTYSYLAPEVLRGGAASPSSDMWSAGMVLHALLLGCLPVDEVRIGQVPLDVRHQDYAQLATDVKSLLTKLLPLNGAQRLTADAAVQMTASMKTRSESHRLQGGMRTVMGSFQRFHRSQMLRKAVLTALAMQCVASKMDELREKFMSADRNGDGRVSKSELAASITADDLKDWGDTGVSMDVGKWIDQVFASIDTDGSQSIEYTEWVAAALQEGSLRCEQSILAAFRSFDTDNSGKISAQEFQRVVLGTSADVAKLMPRFDRNGDGEIDLEEFKLIILDPPSENVREDSKPPVANMTDTGTEVVPPNAPVAAQYGPGNVQLLPAAGGYGNPPLAGPQVRQREGVSMGNCCFCGT